MKADPYNNPYNTEAKNEAFRFLSSMRGQYIMAQALTVAIKTLSEVPAPHTEVSNISDMQYLKDEIFTFPVF